MEHFLELTEGIQIRDKETVFVLGPIDIRILYFNCRKTSKNLPAQ